ncbi:MAG: hypothetical protein IJ809_04055 [Clostridia bacterium]|nr:hypothetical protein [Clostridia bacterium]
MRTLELGDILNKKYSVVDGEVVETEKGEYFSLEVAQYFAQSDDNKIDMSEMNKALEFDESEYEKEVLRYCDESKEKLFENQHIDSFNEKPTKDYEIFRLNLRKPKTMLLCCKNLPMGRQRELFYDLDIANKVYENIVGLETYAENEFDSVLSNEDILSVNNEIESLKAKDEELFVKDGKVFDALSGTSFAANYNYINEQNEKLIKENMRLKEDLSDNNQKIIELTVKLQNAIETIEDLNRPKSFVEKFKELFKNDGSAKMIKG